MSIELYAVHVVPKDGTVYNIAKSILERRRSAMQARSDYALSVGAKAFFGNDSHITGLIFEAGAVLPVGLRPKGKTEESIHGVPDRKKKKEGRAFEFALRALPSLPDHETFTKEIGSHLIIIGCRMFWCWFEHIDGELFVMTPWHRPADLTGEICDDSKPALADRQAFLPEGCERVGISRYYAAKERAEAKTLQPVS